MKPWKKVESTAKSVVSVHQSKAAFILDGGQTRLLPAAVRAAHAMPFPYTEASLAPGSSPMSSSAATESTTDCRKKTGGCEPEIMPALFIYIEPRSPLASLRPFIISKICCMRPMMILDRGPKARPPERRRLTKEDRQPTCSSSSQLLSFSV